MTTSKRLIGIDFLKSISIFGVVFIHSRNDNIISEITSELFRVAVPLFIVFFSYFLEKNLSSVSTKKEYNDILKQKLLLTFYNPLLNWLLKRADKIIATSPNYINGSKYLSKHFSKCEVIPIGIDHPQKVENINISVLYFYQIQ